MAFDYDKFKSHQNNNHQWSSYSDLFMALSVIFLLLYVTASLRQGAYSVQKHMEKQKLTHKVQDLKQQLKVYNALKKDYLKREATQQEKKLYGQLMDRLSLLENKAKKKKQKLRKKADQTEKKQQALNKYQQMVRNIVNANIVAKGRIDKREDIIQEKESVISKKHQQIDELEKKVEEKKQQILEGEKQIAQVRNQLKSKVKDLKQDYKRQKISKENMKKRIANLKQTSRTKIKDLKKTNKKVSRELSQATNNLSNVSSRLEKARQKIQKTSREKRQLMSELEKTSQKYKERMGKLKKQFKKEKRKKQKEFERKLKQQKLSAKARARKKAKFAEKLAKKKKELKKKLGSLNKKMHQKQAELKQARAKANARKRIARKIKENFKKAGIKAKVDGETGDVTLDFEDHYFDTNKANLKTGMKKILRKAMPAYSKSLFSNKEIAEKIEAVEIVGYASPTYKGQYVDPKSLSPEDREAVNYNLDLSFNRARSIFNYAFDKKNMNFEYQKQMLPLVKVTGRSFLSEVKKKRDISSEISVDKFCKKYDCKEAQKVIIQFNLEE